jgi:hypothetical protein
LADLLKLGLDLLAVVANSPNVLVCSLGLLLLLNGGDDAPGGTSGANDVLVCYREEVSLIDGKFTTDLVDVISYCRMAVCTSAMLIYLGDLLNK